MSTIELKIKRKVLAHEARLIRGEELQARQQMRFQNASANRDMTDKRLRKLGLTASQLRRVRARRAANEQVEAYGAATAFNRMETLRKHRLEVVRPAARAAHLANGYLRNQPYCKMEGAGSMAAMPRPLRDALLKDVAKNIRTFGGELGLECKPKDVEFWIEGGHTLMEEETLAEA